MRAFPTLCLFLALLSFSQCSGHRTSITIEGKNITSGNGMVVSAHPEASLIGTVILKKGGNAIDAAIATEFALAVCYPEAGNIGGGGFMLIRKADGKTDVIDYREKASGNASRDMFLDSAGNIMESFSTETHLASGVPGTVDGMVRAHSLYGSLPFKDLIQPAVDLAEKGFHLTGEQADHLNSRKTVFLKRNASIPAFVRAEEWKEGDLLVQHDLAGTLKRIRDNGRDGFYSGITADLILKEMQRGKGIISETDLRDYISSVRTPLTADYRGYRIITVPPPSSGGIILIQLLKMIEPYNVKEMGFGSPATIHLVTEAERRSFADRSEYMGDPDFMKVQVKDLISDSYLGIRMQTFNENYASASADIMPGVLVESDETTHYSVVDAMGNAVSATTTLNGTFGSSIVVEGAGFLLNNQMDDFSIKPGSPNMYGLVGGEANSIMPGKKMLSSMTPAIVEKEGKLFLVAGSPGGSTIPTTVFQIITNVIDHGMDISAAVDAPRFHHQWLPDIISYEKEMIDSTTLDILIAMGHTMQDRASLGRVNAIMVMENGNKSGAADRRGDNSACGY